MACSSTPTPPSAFGKVPTRVDELGVDLLSVAGHRAYAPKGIGALYVRRGVRLEPVVHGADHESGRRAGTESAARTSGSRHLPDWLSFAVQRVA